MEVLKLKNLCFHINRYFLKSKELPIDKFIDNVMFNKNHGYYSKKIAFGSKGDFVTSPEISFLFSEMIAIWIISFWMHLKKPKNNFLNIFKKRS